jgi:hypothetical protein
MDDSFVLNVWSEQEGLVGDVSQLFPLRDSGKEMAAVLLKP